MFHMKAISITDNHKLLANVFDWQGILKHEFIPEDATDKKQIQRDACPLSGGNSPESFQNVYSFLAPSHCLQSSNLPGKV
jgi:hypothetical protein